MEILLIGLGVYIVSLYLNPFVDCSRCKGKPKQKGWMFSYAKHVCDKCGGSGLQMRLGRRFLPGKPRGS